MPRRRITLDLDEELIRAADRAAKERRQSRSQIIVDSLSSVLTQLERERVEAAFPGMAEDLDYRREMLSIDQGMSSASARAWACID